MNNQWRLCQSCIVRHCNKAPTIRKGTSVGASILDTYICVKYRKHQEGFKFSEVRYEKEKQV